MQIGVTTVSKDQNINVLQFLFVRIHSVLIQLPKVCAIEINQVKKRDNGLWECFLEVDTDNPKIYKFTQEVKVNVVGGNKKIAVAVGKKERDYSRSGNHSIIKKVMIIFKFFQRKIPEYT